MSRDARAMAAAPPSLALRVLRSPWTFQILATALFLGVLAWRVDLGGITGPLRRADYRWAALGVAVFPLTRILDTTRWRLYLAKVGRVPLRELLGAFLVGNLANNVLPARIGDLVKIQVVANRHGLSRAGLAASRAVESVIDGVTFLLVLLLAIALSDVAFAAPALLWGMAVAAVFGLAATMLLSRALPSQLPGWRILRAVPGRLRRVVDDALPRLRDGLETMRNPRHLGEAVALNVASWGVQAVMFVMLGLAFDLDLSPGAYIGITIAANAVTVLPITFENIGTYEVLVLEVLSLAGVPRDDALAYAVASHAITNAWVIALGIAAMWAMRLRPREVFGIRGQGG